MVKSDQKNTASHTISSNLEKEILSTGLEGILNGIKTGFDPLGAVYATPEQKYLIGGQGLYDNYQQTQTANYSSFSYKASKFLGFLAGAAANLYTLGGIQLLSILYDVAKKPKTQKQV